MRNDSVICDVIHESFGDVFVCEASADRNWKCTNFQGLWMLKINQGFLYPQQAGKKFLAMVLVKKSLKKKS